MKSYSFRIIPVKDLSPMFTRKTMSKAVATLVVAGFSALSLSAAAQTKVTYLTNWYAQAEHGGFYQAVAEGTYKKYGLDVTVKMGGPQVNALQLLAAGQADFYMGYDIQTYKAWEQGIQAVNVAAAFQKDPQVMIAHDDVQKFEDLKDRSLLISSAAHTAWYPWAKAKYGFTDAQARPYTFNIQPFMADKKLAQQGYLSSEPYSITQAGGKIKVFLMADLGYPPYSTTITTLKKTIDTNPKMVADFVKASMEGWASYMKNPAPGNALIKKDNPNMTDDKLANGVKVMKENGIVGGGDAAKMGIGIMTEARMKQTWEMMVANKLIDPTKVKFNDAWTDKFVKDLKILP
jgi:NitT/TauT family transport system substrate-binding protein